MSTETLHQPTHVVRHTCFFISHRLNSGRRKKTRKKINENNLLANDFLLFFPSVVSFAEMLKKALMWLWSLSENTVFWISSILLILSPEKKTSNEKLKNTKKNEETITCVRASRNSAPRISILEFYEPWWIWNCRIFWQREQIFNCLFSSTVLLHYRIMTHKKTNWNSLSSQSTAQRLINSLACLTVCTMSFGLQFRRGNSSSEA